MAYTKTNWVNDNTLAINATNLNKIEQGIYDNSQDIINITDKMNNVSIAKIRTNGTLDITSEIKVTGIWTSEFQYGDYVNDVQNSRIVITNTEILEVTGLVGGLGPGWNGISIEDQDGVSINDGNASRVLNDESGFWSSSLPVSYYQLDKTQTYYVYLYCAGYNGTFKLNSGMGSRGTLITARKIK